MKQSNGEEYSAGRNKKVFYDQKTVRSWYSLQYGMAADQAQFSYAYQSILDQLWEKFPITFSFLLVNHFLAPVLD